MTNNQQERMMQRVLIIGNAGAGKSTFAKKLSAKTRLPLVHLDKLYWQGNWDHLGRDEFDALLQAELEKSSWIMDGNFNRTIPHRLKYCDTVFFFDLPTVSCLWGITKRIFQNYGKTRPDMGGSCPEYFDKQKISLYKNVLHFNKQHRRAYYDLLATSDAAVVVFRSHRQADDYLTTRSI